MALTAGRLPFPKIALKSPDIAEDTLQHTSHALPANLFVLVRYIFDILFHSQLKVPAISPTKVQFKETLKFASVIFSTYGPP
nr:unnamed protein product [Haemonchus contortus]